MLSVDTHQKLCRICSRWIIYCDILLLNVVPQAHSSSRYVCNILLSLPMLRANYQAWSFTLSISSSTSYERMMKALLCLSPESNMGLLLPCRAFSALNYFCKLPSVPFSLSVLWGSVLIALHCSVTGHGL